MALKKFFNFFKGEEEPEEPLVDPIIEQRRKEKFSTPLIYNEEEEVNQQAETAQPKPVKPAVMKKTRPETTLNYSMSEIISPMLGKKELPKTETKPKVTKTKKKKSIDIKDQLVPVISPFYGNTIVEEETELEVKTVKEEPVEKVKTIKYNTQGPESVTENLRNLAKIIQEEENQLKIIEARTGEFQLDFSNLNGDEKTLIDEIDDEMTLDELMSLYEKKKMTD